MTLLNAQKTILKITLLSKEIAGRQGKDIAILLFLKIKKMKKETNKFGSMKYYSDICRCIKEVGHHNADIN